MKWSGWRENGREGENRRRPTDTNERERNEKKGEEKEKKREEESRMSFGEQSPRPASSIVGAAVLYPRSIAASRATALPSTGALDSSIIGTGIRPVPQVGLGGPYKAFVGQISSDLSPPAVHGLFEVCGPVIKLNRPMDPAGRPQKFAFVEFASAEGLSRALRFLDGRQIGDSTMTIRADAATTQRMEQHLKLSISDSAELQAEMSRAFDAVIEDSRRRGGISAPEPQHIVKARLEQMDIHVEPEKEDYVTSEISRFHHLRAEDEVAERVRRGIELDRMRERIVGTRGDENADVRRDVDEILASVRGESHASYDAMVRKRQEREAAEDIEKTKRETLYSEFLRSYSVREKERLRRFGRSVANDPRYRGDVSSAARARERLREKEEDARDRAADEAEMKAGKVRELRQNEVASTETLDVENGTFVGVGQDVKQPAAAPRKVTLSLSAAAPAPSVPTIAFEEEDSGVSLKEGDAKRRKLVPIDYSEEEKNAVSLHLMRRGQMPERLQESEFDMVVDVEKEIESVLKETVSRIPALRDDLFATPIRWELIDAADVIHTRMRKWLSRKMKEYLGEEVPSLMDFLVQKLEAHSEPDVFRKHLAFVLEDDAVIFVEKMWRMVIYEVLRLERSAP